MSVRFTFGAVMLALAAAASGCTAPALRGGLPTAHNLPPAQMIAHPGPGVGGPGPGIIPNMPPVGFDAAMPAPTVQVHFRAPVGMEIRWDVGGVGLYDSEPLVVPGIQNFPENGVYRLKVTGIEGREDERLYPSLEVGPITARTAAYLAHTPIPIQFTEQDFDQALSGNFVTKVIYIPDPEFQELAIGGVDTLVSTRLDPGVDPIVEADRRGAILAIIRLGRKDLEAPGAAMGGAMQTGFSQELGMAPGFSPVPFNGGGAVPSYVSGVTGPQYGYPITGTPIDDVAYVGFILMLGITMVAGPGVPGGASMAAIGLLRGLFQLVVTVVGQTQMDRHIGTHDDQQRSQFDQQHDSGPLIDNDNCQLRSSAIQLPAVRCRAMPRLSGASCWAARSAAPRSRRIGRWSLV